MHLIFKDKSNFKDYSLFNEQQSLEYIPNFNRINIIVGANNSGKSRFMRLLMNIREYEFIENDHLVQYNSLVFNYNQKLTAFHNGDSFLLKPIKPGTDVAADISLNESQYSNNRFGIEYVFSRAFSNLGYILSKRQFDKVIYIPTLRTAHSLFEKQERFTKIENDIFLDTLINNYQLDTKKIQVFTGIHLHREILNTRNAKRSIRKSFENFERFISKYFFSGKQVDIVAEFNKEESLKGQNHSEIISIHIQGENDSRDLDKLGDGIQAIIVLMYKIFLAEPNSLIFIDEPELNLHPGMQRLFLEQIYFNKELIDKSLTYIIATHSNHFLDLTLEKDDISIYAFSPKNNEEGKDKEFIIKNVNRGDNSILRDLGVNNSSVFLANSSIWVEGISDRNYIKAFLKAYIKHLKIQPLKEDIDYAFFEYAGTNIEHYIFDRGILEDERVKVEKYINALVLSNKIFLLADSDNAHEQSAKAERIQKLKSIKASNFTFEVLEDAREIENLLPNSVWEKVLINFCNKKIIANREDEVQNNIDIALTKVDSQSYKSEYIGKYLSEVSKRLKLDNEPILNKIYKKNKGSGTLIPKRELSEIVLEKVERSEITWQSFEDNPEIVRITKAVYEFVTT